MRSTEPKFAKYGRNAPGVESVSSGQGLWGYDVSCPPLKLCQTEQCDGRGTYHLSSSLRLSVGPISDSNPADKMQMRDKTYSRAQQVWSGGTRPETSVKTNPDTDLQARLRTTAELFHHQGHGAGRSPAEQHHGQGLLTRPWPLNHHCTRINSIRVPHFPFLSNLKDSSSPLKFGSANRPLAMDRNHPD